VTPAPTSLPNEITDAKGVQMMLVPAGEFTMGSDNGDTDETPVHEPYLDAFYMDKYEVTNSLYRSCVDASACEPPKSVKYVDNRSYYDNPEFDTYPVTYLTWYMAETYCSWRGAKLPTEAQWEKAARGTDGRTYPWGEDIDCDHTNYDFYCTRDISEVGKYESGQSPFGIHDLAGNVWEWVADWYSESSYQNSTGSNPLGPDNGKYKVLRGGAWNDDEKRVSTSYRLNLNPSFITYATDCYTNTNNMTFCKYHYYYTGVRCAKDVSP
jgi:formylglycine-generating enzyme required for sulfatase activity